MPSDASDTGFSLVDALVGLAIAGTLFGLIVDLLATDTRQTRRFIARSEDAVAMLQARRLFNKAASQATGPASAEGAGELRIVGDKLVLGNEAKGQTLLQWDSGSASFSYSKNGRSWAASSPDAGIELVRFTLRRNGKATVWIAP